MIDDLIGKLEDNEIVPFVFADDLSTVQEGIKKTKLAIKIIDDWTKDNEFKTNYKKSAILVHHYKQTKNVYTVETKSDACDCKCKNMK